MTAAAMAEWVARGRTHQHQGRPADALPCFRRASREDPRSPLPLFHLGEAYWQLGVFDEAAAAWHRSARLDASFAPPRQALAEAALLHGDFATAATMAGEAAKAAAQDPRAAAAAAAAAAALHDPEGMVRSATLLLEAPALVKVPALARAWAAAMDAPDSESRRALLQALAAQVERAAPVLLAALCEHGVPMPEGLANRSWSQDDVDVLRRIAVATASSDPRLSETLAVAHGALVGSLPSPPVPLLWPRRTAGKPLRIAWIAPMRSSPAWDVWLGIVAASRLTADASHLVLTTEPPELVQRELAPTVLAAAPLLLMPKQSTAETARALAARDCDLVIDAAGLTAATGSMLAMRPARRVLALRSGVPEHRVPLVDGVVDDAAALDAALAQIAATIGEGGGSTVAELMARWDVAVARHREGDLEAALAAYAEILREQPDSAPALQLSGAIARDAGATQQAQVAFDAALVVAPDFVEARLSAGELALAGNDVAAALRIAREGVARAPLDVGLWRLLGQAELQGGDGKAAEVSFSRALQVAPANADLHFHHGVALQMAGDDTGAARAWQRALTFDPAMVGADFNLGVLFARSGNADAAIAAFGQVLELSPDHVAAYKNLGETLFAAGRIDAWFANFDRFCARCPAALPMAVQSLEVGAHRGDFARIESTLDGLRRDAFKAANDIELVDCLEELLYLLLFVDVEPEFLLTMATRYNEVAKRVYGEPMTVPATRRPGRLRVGYLSADLRNHVMGKMIWQAVAHHDAARFELHCYSTSRERDEWTQRFATVATIVDVSAQDDAAAAARIAEDDLDLLVDLSTHTRGARPGILARKPARVQLTHVASAGTLGLSAIDWKITDAFADLPENQAWQVERLLVMEGCVYPFRSVAAVETPLFDRKGLRIPQDAFVIGAFVSPLKLSRRCLALWRDVLQRVPTALLAFSPAHPAHRASYVRLAAAAGIDEKRLVFIPQGRDDAENQARYRVVDVVLDTMPFGGVNGTMEALAMQVPVVTLVGRRHGERTSYSILANLGVLDTVAHSGREYVEIAQRIAGDASFRADLKRRIAAGLEHSVLVDMPGHTRNLEAAYLRAMAGPASIPNPND